MAPQGDRRHAIAAFAAELRDHAWPRKPVVRCESLDLGARCGLPRGVVGDRVIAYLLRLRPPRVVVPRSEDVPGRAAARQYRMRWSTSLGDGGSSHRKSPVRAKTALEVTIASRSGSLLPSTRSGSTSRSTSGVESSRPGRA